VQLCRQLRAGGASADDRDMELFRPQLRRLRVPPDVCVHQPCVEALRLQWCIQRNSLFAHAGSTEVVALAADGDDQRIVGEAARRRHLAPLLVEVGGEMNLALAAIKPNQLADAIAERMPMRLCQKIDLMHT